MSKKHIFVNDEGETFISAKEAKKRFGIEKGELNKLVRENKVREIIKEEHTKPHTFVDKSEIVLHFYSLSDIERELKEKK